MCIYLLIHMNLKIIYYLLPDEVHSVPHFSFTLSERVHTLYRTKNLNHDYLVNYVL